jgi:uncharacterized protein (TIGR02145 family)
VAYSYNSTTSPAYPASPATTVTVASPNDLLWGEAKDEEISVIKDEVTITMKHKFSQVRVEAKMTGANITDIHDVTVSPGNSADLTVETGNLAKNGSAVAVPVPFSRWDGVNTQTVTSDSVVIYTGISNIYVDLGSITIEGYDVPFTNARAVFNKVLEEGYSYTLLISFKQTLWAKSNIYWVSTGPNTGYLTFDTNENGHQGYQGVFFKWGSLVGISPAQPDAFSTSIPVYIPNYNAGNPLASTWSAPTTSTYTWSATDDSGTNPAPATDIPYMDGSYSTTDYSRNNIFVMDEARNRPEDYAKKVGDICQYLGITGAGPAGYRMPTSSEMGTTNEAWNGANPVGGGWVKGSGSWPTADEQNGAGSSDGKTDLIQVKGLGSAVNGVMGVVLPASGYRQHSDGVLFGVGRYAHYWTGSAHSATYGKVMRFNSTNVYPDTGNGRSCGFPVRCVKNEN